MLWFISVLLLCIGYQMYLIKKYKNLNKDEMSYVATLTHDLKNPTYAQINILNLLLKGQFGKLNPKQYEMLSMTCSSAKYMSNLVGTVLSGYKLGQNSITLHKTNFDLIALIDSIVNQNKLLISEKGLNLIFNRDTNKCTLHADKIHIERVLNNLLSNAITYGFRNTNIIINLSTENNYINFSISNKCNYIPKRELKNIFRKFSQTANSKFNKAATGLGLYSAKRIINMHCGKIFAKSTPDGTCTFGFRLEQKQIPCDIIKK